MKSILVFIIAFAFYRIVLVPEIRKMRKKNEIPKDIKSLFDPEEMKKAIEEAMKETELLQSKEVPSDEDIELYYKMYLKKWDLDHGDEWHTEEFKPISWEAWVKMAKEEAGTRIGGYHFIISHTMDIFMGGSMSRCTDYKRLVEEDERMKNEK